MSEHVEQETFGPFAEINVFQYGDYVCSLHQILAWAEFTGRLEAITAHLRRTERALLATSEVMPEHVNQAVTEFRYRHNLITAEETEVWLAERNLARDDLYRHVYRIFCSDPMEMALSENDWCEAVPDPFAEIWAELHFTGQFDVLVEEFLFRVAAMVLNPPEEKRTESLNLNVSHLAKLLIGPYFEFVRTTEGCYLEHAERVADRETCERRLKSQRMGLLRVQYQALSYPAESAAREAYSCMVFDNEEPHDLAERTGVLVRTGTAFVEDLPEDLGRHLLSAQPDECLAPIQLASHEGYTVCKLLTKEEPRLSSGPVISRIKRRIVAESLEAEIESNLQWLPWRPEGDE